MMKRTVLGFVTAAAALMGAGCGAAPGDGDGAGLVAADTPVKVYWTATDENGNQVLKQDTITEGQKREMFARKALARRAAAEDRKNGIVRQANTDTATDWSTCGLVQYTATTSQSNGGGDLLCIRYVSSGGNTSPVWIPFLPAWHDSAQDGGTAKATLLCTGSSNCYYLECGVNGSAVWKVIGESSSYGTNISPPSSVRYIDFLYNGPC